MAKLPAISGSDAVRAFQRIGYEVHHQKGSHIILRQRVEPFRRLSVPNHKELKAGLLRGLIGDAGLTVGEFTKLL